MKLINDGFNFFQKKKDIDNLYGPNFFLKKTYPIVFHPHFLILFDISPPAMDGDGKLWHPAWLPHQTSNFIHPSIHLPHIRFSFATYPLGIIL
jgi:hypothetical protein